MGSAVLTHLFARFAVFVRAPDGAALLQLCGPTIRAQQQQKQQQGRTSKETTDPLRARIERPLYQGPPCNAAGVPCADWTPPALFVAPAASKRAARRLVCDVFWAPRGNHTAHAKERTYRRPHVPTDLRALVPLFVTMLRRHHRCAYGAILRSVLGDKYEVPVAAGEATDANAPEEKTKQEEGDIARLLALRVPPSAVVVVLWACFNRVVPRELVGGTHNRRALHRRLVELVSLRRGEALCAAHLLQGMRLSEVPWLCTKAQGQAHPSPSSRPRRLFGLWLRFLFGAFFARLLRYFFYCTDAAHTGLRVHYYRHRVWRELRGVALAQLARAHLRPVPTEAAAARRRPLALPALRIVPRAHGVRVLTDMSRARHRPRAAPAPNAALRTLLAVLGHERARAAASTPLSSILSP